MFSFSELFEILEYIARDDLDDFFRQSKDNALTTPSKNDEDEDNNSQNLYLAKLNPL